MDRPQGRLPFEATEEIAASAAEQHFSGVDGRKGPAIDRLNLALDALLEEDFGGAGIQLNNEGRVTRAHYAKRLGIHQSYLCKACYAILEKWDARLHDLNGGLSPTARAFVELVRSDSKTDAGVIVRRNRIFLKHYADRLGVTPRLIARTMGSALSQLEAELIEAGLLKTKVKASISRAPKIVRDPDQGAQQASKLQTLLEEDDRSDVGIHFNHLGKVSRSHYAAALGIGDSKLSPESRNVLASWDADLAERNEGLSPLARRFLDAVEADKGTPGGIVATGHRLVDMPHYAGSLGVSVAGIRLALGDRLSAFNNSLAEEGCLRTPLEKKLLAEVDRDLVEGRRPKLGRAGKLHRQHYAQRLGVHEAHLARSCRQIFEVLDREHGASSNAEARLDEMRQWLEDQYERRVLPIRDGKLDRTLFQQAFELKGGTFMVRYQGIRALFEEFDARAVQESYSPAALDTDVQRLRDALDDSPELNKDQLRISRPALEKKLGIPAARLWQSPFIEEIRKCEEKILHRAKQSLIDPYFAGRVFVFSDLSGLWGTAFLAKIAAQFRNAFNHVDDKENIKSRYLALHDLLSWIGGSDDAICHAVKSATASGRLVDETAWERAVFAYREHVVSSLQQGLRSKRQADQTIAAIRRVLAHMDPVLPKLETELSGIKYARAFTVHRASLAEATSKSRSGADYIEFANSMLRQAADRFKVDLDHDEAMRFTEVLATEIERTRDLPSDPAHAILLVLNRRLSAISDAAAKIMEKARADMAEGETLLSQADVDGNLFYRKYAGLTSKSHTARELVRQWFPSPVGLNDYAAQAARRRARANLLALAVAEFDGILPGTANQKAAANLGQFFQKRYNDLGAKESLVPLLNPSRDACGAALTLYLVESGANVSVGRTLEHGCVEPSNQPGFKLITGHKARAKGKPIYAELPSDSPAIRAIEWYGKHSARYRAKVDRADSRSLFILQVGERCQLATPHWYTGWFKRFASEIPALHQADVVPSMIRPSVLLKAALENDGRLQVGRAIGQHSQAVTRGYQEKLPIRLLRDQHMRRFQRHFETRVLQNVVDVARNLGISAEEFEQRIAELQATGLGTFCADPYARPGSEGQRCQTVDCWRECPQLLVVANVEAIALLQIWQKSLSEARGDWERDHPERWGEVWLPWLCLTEVVQKRMSRGPLLLTWKQAEKRATELMTQSNFVPPRPF